MEDDFEALQLRIGANVKELRRLRGLSQDALAAAIGRERNHVSDLELGKVNISLKTLWALAKEFDVDVPHLCGSRSGGNSGSATYSIMRRDVEQMVRILDRVKQSALPHSRAKRRPSTKR